MYLKNLIKIRKQRGLTQEKLSRDADISYHTLIKIEQGAIDNPKIATVIKIAKALKVKLDDLVK